MLEITDVFELEYSNNLMIINGFHEIEVTGVNDCQFVSLLKNQNVSIITIDCKDITDEMLSRFSVVPTITNITLKNCMLTDNCFKYLKDIPKLKFISLINNKNITGENISYLNNTTVEMIDLSHSNVTKDSLVHISKLRDIKICLDHNDISFKDLFDINFNETIQVVSKGYFKQEQLNVLSMNQIINNVKNKFIDLKLHDKTSKRLHEFFNYITKWYELYSNNSTNEVADFYINDIFFEYVLGLSTKRYNSNVQYYSGEYCCQSIIAMEEDFNRNILVYTHATIPKSCFKRFTMTNETSKIVKVENLDSGWKEVLI